MPKPLLNIRGIITVLNTPFTADDKIDVDSLQQNVEIAMGAGVAGFLVPAMASEVNKLSSAERELVVSAVLEVTGGKAPVIGGATAANVEKMQEWARILDDQGCDGVLVNIPYTSDDKYVADVEIVAKADPEFLMLQDWSFTDFGVPVPLVARLFEEIDVFKALKIEVVPAGPKYTAVMAATGGRLHVSGGWAVMQMLSALKRGVHAFMPTAMHRIYTRIYEWYHAGKPNEARDLFYKLLPVIAFSNQHLDVSIHFFKRLLHAQGIYTTARVREPVLPFDGVHEAMADELIRRVNDIEKELKD